MTCIMLDNVCICWVRFKNALVGTSRWLDGIFKDEGLRSLNEHQCYIDTYGEVNVSI